jgi:Flp pilus assembly protein TadD
MEKTFILFLDVPDSLNNDIQRFSHNFVVDPSILLPVELDSDKKSLDPAKISWETIISGMLKIISLNGTRNFTPENFAGFPYKSGDIVDPTASVPDEWVDYYRRFVLAVKPDIFHEFTGASIVKSENGDFDMALEISAVLEGLFPGSPGVLLNKALILENLAATLEKNGHAAERENAEALEAIETALATEPVLPDTLFNAGFFFIRRRDFAGARECFKRYLSLEYEADNSAEISGEKRRQAKRIIHDIGGLDSDSFKEAYDCVARGDDEKGLSKIREFIEKYPKTWNGWFILGWALRKLGRYGDSLEALKKAHELAGANCDIFNEMAICLMELGDLKGARRELEHALREEPENVKIISNLGVLAMKTGNKEDAEAFFRTVLELDPDDVLARHYLKAE